MREVRPVDAPTGLVSQSHRCGAPGPAGAEALLVEVVLEDRPLDGLG